MSPLFFHTPSIKFLRFFFYLASIVWQAGSHICSSSRIDISFYNIQQALQNENDKSATTAASFPCDCHAWRTFLVESANKNLKQKSKQQRRKWICCFSCWPLLLTAFVAVAFYELGYYVCWVIELSFFAHTNVSIVVCCCRLGSCHTCNSVFISWQEVRFWGRWGWFFFAISELRCQIVESL